MKPFHWIVPGALTLLAACGSEAADSSATDRNGDGSQPAPAAEPATEEALPTPEEAAAEAQQEIDAANADAELQRLQEELEGG
jgi:hypothetical protein